jgi:cytoskeleton protein RodZ
LPGPTFAQGYIRVYAKFLELSESSVLELYNCAMPQDQSTKLKPRCKLPNEANSQSPLVKTVTMFLIMAGIAAAIYGSFQYYQKKADVMETELESKEHSFTGNSLNSPGPSLLSIRKNTSLTADDELIAGQAGLIDNIAGTEKAEINESDINSPEINRSSIDTGLSDASEELAAQAEAVPEERQQDMFNGAQHDVIEFFAEKGSWMEVRDASNARLFYNMVPKGGNKTLIGQAPFRVSLGNAKTTRVVINDLEIDMSDYVRPNNTAKFTVSSNKQNVIFH